MKQAFHSYCYNILSVFSFLGLAKISCFFVSSPLINFLYVECHIGRSFRL